MFTEKVDSNIDMDGFSHGTIVMRSAPLKLCISYIQETAFLYTHTQGGDVVVSYQIDT